MVRVGDIGHVQCGFLALKRQVGRHGSCGMETVRGREASEAGNRWSCSSSRLQSFVHSALGGLG